MSTIYKVNRWFVNHIELVSKLVEDPEGILLSSNGKKKGVYLVSVYLADENKTIPMYVGEAGADDKTNRTIADRIKEHLMRWLSKGQTEYWTGVDLYELSSGKIKYHLHIVAEEKNHDARKRIESETILSEKPYLQCGPYEKYHSKKQTSNSATIPYNGIDLCIVPWKHTRRKALCDRLAKENIFLEESDFITGVINGNEKTFWKGTLMMIKAKPNAEHLNQYVDSFKKTLVPGSEEYKRVKEIIDEAIGYTKEDRGCTYPIIIKMLSYALCMRDENITFKVKL